MKLRITVAEDIDLPIRLRSARKRARLTLKEVAAAIGRDPSTVHTWETGKRSITYADLAAYGGAVHATITDLIGDELLRSPLR